MRGYFCLLLLLATAMAFTSSVPPQSVPCATCCSDPNACQSVPGHTARLRLYAPFRGHCVVGMCYKENPVFRDGPVERHANLIASRNCQTPEQRANMTAATKTLEKYELNYIDCVIEKANESLRFLQMAAKHWECEFEDDDDARSLCIKH